MFRMRRAMQNALCEKYYFLVTAKSSARNYMISSSFLIKKQSKINNKTRKTTFEIRSQNGLTFLSISGPFWEPFGVVFAIYRHAFSGGFWGRSRAGILSICCRFGAQFRSHFVDIFPTPAFYDFCDPYCTIP